MIDDITLREFTKEDKVSVTAFFDQMGGETRAFFDRGDGNRKNALGYFDGTDKDTVRFLAEHNGKMVGYLFLWDTNRSIPWLGICVSEDLKGKHLGRRLMDLAIDYAKKNNKGALLLTTHTANIRGQALYTHCGFERLGLHSNGEFLYLLRF